MSPLTENDEGEINKSSFSPAKNGTVRVQQVFIIEKVKRLPPVLFLKIQILV